MVKRLSATLVLTASLMLTLMSTWSVLAQEPTSPFQNANQQTNNTPLTLNLNLGAEPPTLDPAKATDTTSGTVIEQLFIGLVDVDDATGEVKPELATTWSVSPDGAIYTFTLRSDITWTDGNPVTAQDVRYGILRSLDPATGSGFAYNLYPIKNAQAYNTGTITDPNQVGVTTLNTTTLRITLEAPLSFLAFFSLAVARPMPQTVIETWGNSWTEPGHIVTSGPYRLTEWVHNDHILLNKNPTYYDATNVQIEQVRMWMVDTDTAGQMYLDGQLDTTSVWTGIPSALFNSPETHFYFRGCTEYYGFSLSQSPFDNLLVRKAFAAAVNRRGLIADELGNFHQPALTFTPPGIFGHVDGYTEGVGIHYNPTQAQQWLAQAGYPNGQGLPPITVWFNAGWEGISEYLQDNWFTTLGVSVTLQSLPWEDYLNQLPNGQFQLWRLGWCMDYPDAYNFLYDAIVPNRSRFGSWANATYDNLLSQTTQEQDPVARQALYKQAEEILVEGDVVMIPLYYSSGVAVTKPYLERTYPAIVAFDIADWRFTWVRQTIGASGGSLTSYDGNTIIQFPPGVFADAVTITFTPTYVTELDDNLTSIGHAFDMTAVYSATGTVVFNTPISYTITISYTEEELGVVIEDTLALYTWSGGQWVQEASEVDPARHILTATANHFSSWAVLGETKRVYLPFILK